MNHRAQAGRILGAVLAGGLSTRFGSDKAQALLDGRRLIDHAVDALCAQCDAIVVVGREDSGHLSVADWPQPNRGPLGGIAGALGHAVDQGYAALLTCGVDSPSLPANLLSLLAPAPAYIRAQPVIGLWPAAASPVLRDILINGTNHSMRHFAERIGARPVDLAADPVNVNTQADLHLIAQKSATTQPQ